MGRPPKNKEAPTAKESLPVEQEVVELKQNVAQITDILANLSAKLDATLKKKQDVRVVPVAPATPGLPPLYRQVVDEILGPQFAVGVLWRTDGHFELTIDVPKQYSNANESHWATYKADTRICVIPNALAENGVKEYAQKVAKNLGEVIMNKVREDKAK